MDYGSGPRPVRAMVDVTSLNLTCADCGQAITELPFQPAMNPDGTPARPVYCRDDNKKRRMTR
jgi:CxxC-x17-CxxC domain-containing protein